MSEINVEELRKYGVGGRLVVVTSDSWAAILDEIEALRSQVAPAAEKPRLVYCAQCGAEPKDPCIEWGKPVGHFHSARLQHLRDLEAELR